MTNGGQLVHELQCDWTLPYYTDSRSARRACWVFDKQLMVHGAFGKRYIWESTGLIGSILSSFFCTGMATSGVGGTNMIYTTMKSMSATIRGQKIANSRRLLILARFQAKSHVVMEGLGTFCKIIFWAVNLLSWLYGLNMRFLSESEPVKCPVTLITQMWGWAAVEGLPGHPIIRNTEKKAFVGSGATI